MKSRVKIPTPIPVEGKGEMFAFTIIDDVDIYQETLRELREMRTRCESEEFVLPKKQSWLCRLICGVKR